MTDHRIDQLREKDHTVLHCIQEGHDDTRKIREQTTLSNRDVNYSLDKLEDIGLIETDTPDGRVTKVVDGQKRNFKAPRQARLTDTGSQYLTTIDREQTQYQEMSHEDLVERVRGLEQQVADLENAFDAFRQQVLKKLE